MNLTQKKFKEYRDYVCRKMKIGKHLYDVIASDIEQYFEPYNPKTLYAGAGDSSDKNESLTSKIVPEAYDNFIYYVHDGFYKIIRLAKTELEENLKYYTYTPTRYKDWKKFADKLMFIMMRKHGLLAYVYYRAVRMFGRV